MTTNVGIRISAQDDTGKAFATVRQNLSGMQKDAASAGGAFAGMADKIGPLAASLAAAYSVGSLVAYTQANIDAADAMNDMSQRVGIAVGDLAKYQLAADQSGTSMEAVAKGIKGMAANLVEHGAALKKAGIDATSADAAMMQLADVFAAMPDGMEKTTLATKMFGKAGMDLIPMLNLGSKGLATAAEKSAEYALQMAALAPLADAFNDNMGELALASKTFGMTLANQLMPTLISVSGEMLDSKNGTNALAEAMGKGLNTVLETSIVLLSDVGFVVKGVGREIGALAAQYVAFMSLDFKGFSAIGDAVKFDAEKARAELDAFQARVLAARSIAAQPVVGTYAQRSGVGYKAPADAAAVFAAVGAAEKSGRAAKSAADEFSKLNAEIARSGELAAEQLSSGGALAESDKYRINTLDKLIEAYQKGKITLSQYIDLESKMTDVENTKRMGEEAKAALKISEDRAALRKKEYEDAAAYGLAQTDLYNAQIKGAEEALAAAQAEYAQYGLSKSQIAEITLLTLQSTQAKYQDGSEGYAAVQKQIDAQRALIGVLKNTEGLEAAKKVADAWQQTANSISDNLTDAFMGAITNSENLFQNLAKSVERMFADMVLRPVVQGVVNDTMSAIGLGSTASTTSGIMGMANTASSLNSIWGAGSQLLTGASAGASTASLIGANAVGAIGGDALGTLATLNGGWAGVAAGATEAGAAAGASAATSTLSAIPVWGWAALAVAAIASFAGNDRLPSQGTGEGQISFDATGAVTDSYSRFGEGDSNLGLTTAVSDTITALYTDYAKTAAALGIQLVDTQFSFGANTGLEGKDPQFAIGSNAGGVGYSSGEIQQTDEAVQLAASRAVFNALQQSELPKYLAGAFDGLTASTATQEQITAALDGASALQSFHDQLQLMPWDGLKDMAYATTQALVDLSGGLDALQSNLGTFYDNFYTDTAKTEALTTNTAAAFAALGITMPAVDEGMRDWYRTLVESVLALDQSDAANAGATVAVLALQTAVDSLAPAFDNTTKSIEDAASAMQEWQDRLDVLQGTSTERAQQYRDDLAGAADDATRALITMTYAAEDVLTNAESAFSVLDKSVAAAKTAAQINVDLAAEQADAIRSVFDAIGDNVEQLYGSVDSTKAQGATAANAFISQALATAKTTGYLPDSNALADAIASARGGLDPNQYTTKADYDAATLTLAGQLDQLKTISGEQLSASELAQKTAEESLENLDSILSTAQEQLDAMLGTTIAVLSVSDAVAALAEALNPKAKASTAAGSTSTSGGSGVSFGPGVSEAVTPSKYTQKDTVAGYGLVSTNITDPNQVAGLDYVAAMVNAIGVATPADVQRLADTSRQYGYSMQDLANATGYTLDSVKNVFSIAGVPAFASGGYHSGGLAMVGEQGPELVNFAQPAQIYTAGQTSSMFGGNTERLEALVEGLTKEVQRLQMIVDTGNGLASRSATALEGNQRRPILVEVAT